MSILPMDADILAPSDDRIFKVLFTHPNAKKGLIDVISAVIERTVIGVHIRGNETPAMDVDEKNQRFDINCTIDTGDQINVEMHCFPQNERGCEHTGFINKYVYFLTDLHSSQESAGKEYRNLVKTYQITFCMYNVLPSLPDHVNRFTLRTNNGIQLTDQINIIIIELNKINEMLKKPVEEMTSFEKWSLFIKYAPDPVHRKMINDIISNKKEIDMAATLLQEISKDEHERARLLSRKKYEMDMTSAFLSAERRGMEQGMEKGMEKGIEKGIEKGMAEGIEKGKAEGIAKGKAEGKSEIIALLKKGVSLEEIEKMSTK